MTSLGDAVAVADAEQVEGVPLERGGPGDELEGWQGRVDRLDVVEAARRPRRPGARPTPQPAPPAAPARLPGQ